MSFQHSKRMCFLATGLCLLAGPAAAAQFDRPYDELIKQAERIDRLAAIRTQISSDRAEGESYKPSQWQCPSRPTPAVAPARPPVLQYRTAEAAEHLYSYKESRGLLQCFKTWNEALKSYLLALPAEEVSNWKSYCHKPENMNLYKTAMDYYQDIGFGYLNRNLRTFQSNHFEGSFKARDCQEIDAQYARKLLEEMASYAGKYDALNESRVFRRITLKDGEVEDFIRAYEECVDSEDPICWNHFISTSANTKGIQGATKTARTIGNNNVIDFTIAGLGVKLRGYDAEEEILIPPGAVFKVERVQHGSPLVREDQNPNDKNVYSIKLRQINLGLMNTSCVRSVNGQWPNTVNLSAWGGKPKTNVGAMVRVRNYTIHVPVCKQKKHRCCGNLTHRNL